MTNRFRKVLSKVLTWSGAIIFLLGGKFLYEIQNHSFLPSEAIGILAGLLLILLGMYVGGEIRKEKQPEEK